MTPREIAETIARALSGKKAVDIRALEVTDVTVLADYFIICTGTSVTHIKTLTEEVEKALRDCEDRAPRIEGRRAGGWVLMDFGCVVVHLFLSEVREFYSLERLWNDARPVAIDGL